MKEEESVLWSSSTDLCKTHLQTGILQGAKTRQVPSKHLLKAN